MQVLKDLPLLSDTPMQKREVWVQSFYIPSLTFYARIYAIGSVQAETSALWSDI